MKAGREKHLQSDIRHLWWDLVRPVPTWNLHHRGVTRYKWQALLPESLSAPCGVGGLTLGHDGRSDPSQVVAKKSYGRGDRRSDCSSGRHRKRLALHLVLNGRRIVIRGVVTQRREADPRQVVGQRAGRLVVVAARLHLQRPLQQRGNGVALVHGCAGHPQDAASALSGHSQELSDSRSPKQCQRQANPPASRGGPSSFQRTSRPTVCTA